MKKNTQILLIACACIMSISGCANDEPVQTTAVTSEAPIIIDAGDAEVDNQGDKLLGEETVETTEEFTPIIRDYGEDKWSDDTETSETTVKPSEIAFSTESIIGYWADTNGNAASIFPDGTISIMIDSGNTYYTGEYETDNLTYINVDVHSGVDKGETITLPDLGDIHPNNNYIDVVDVTKLPEYHEEMTEEEIRELIKKYEYVYEEDPEMKEIENPEEETEHTVITTVKISIKGVREENGTYYLSVVNSSGETLELSGYKYMKKNSGYYN